MKGDLNTLKKVCKYASIVMKIGEVVFGGLIIATVVMGAAALFFDALEGAFYDWIGMKATDETLKVVSMFIVTLNVFSLGYITVRMIHDIMVSIKTEYTPFVPENAMRIKFISMSFLFSSVLLLLFGSLAGLGVRELLFAFFGSLMVAVVMYCLTIVTRYGGLLQKESDETL